MAFPIPLYGGRDSGGAPLNGIPFPNDIFEAILAQTTASSFTVPTSASKWTAVFFYEYDANVFIRVGDTASVPSSGTFVAGDSLLNPARIVNLSAGQTISAITPDTNAYVTVALYSTQA